VTIYEKTQKIFREAEEKQRIEWENDTDSLREQTLMQASPIMLKALLAAKKGDTSLIDYAIAHAMGEKKWTD